MRIQMSKWNWIKINIYNSIELHQVVWERYNILMTENTDTNIIIFFNRINNVNTHVEKIRIIIVQIDGVLYKKWSYKQINVQNYNIKTNMFIKF